MLVLIVSSLGVHLRSLNMWSGEPQLQQTFLIADVGIDAVVVTIVGARASRPELYGLRDRSRKLRRKVDRERSR